MNENYDTEEFERTLKEHADRFFLIPSERVWKSIYNDIHPGSKWPSLAVGLFMLLTLFWIGNVNQEYPIGLLPSSADKTIDAGRDASELINKTTGSFIQDPASQTTSVLSDSLTILAAPLPLSRNHNRLAPSAIAQIDFYRSVHPDKYSGETKDLPASSLVTPTVEKKSSDTESADQAPKVISGNVTGSTPDKANSSTSEISGKIDLNNANERQPILKLNADLRKKLKWEFTFMPIISDVKFMGANLNKVNSTVVNTPVSKHDMNIAKRLGFITGANVFYPLSRKVSLTSGVHLIYTGYDIFSEVVQPNTTSLTFKDSKGQLFSKYYVSYYANDKRNNNTSITNYNWQLSVPVGAEWEVVSGGKVKISLLSTIEPFMVLGNKAYLLSGDASSYVTDPDLVRKFNLSGNIGGMLHFTGQTTNWKVGPNFRYQILSTYNDIYPVKEHFINYGIQVGVSKK